MTMNHKSALWVGLMVASLGACERNPSNPIGVDPITSGGGPQLGTSLSSGLQQSTTGSIQAYTNTFAFRARLEPSTIRIQPQDPTRLGTDMGGGRYEIALGGVRIQTEGPGFYTDIAGRELLSKGVPVVLLFPPGTEGAGVEIAQFSQVDVTVTDDNGDFLELAAFSNGGLAFLGFTSRSGISRIEFSDPSPGDTMTPITNLGDVTFGSMSTSLFPMSCGVLANLVPTARARVQGNQVTVTATAHGVGIPGEADVSPFLEGSYGRFAFWPNGRHNPPKITSELFSTMEATDFPVQVSLSYRHNDITQATTIQANLDYEILSAAYDNSGRLRLGGRDENSGFQAGEFVILQCDRGLTYVIRP